MNVKLFLSFTVKTKKIGRSYRTKQQIFGTVALIALKYDFNWGLLNRAHREPLPLLSYSGRRDPVMHTVFISLCHAGHEAYSVMVAPQSRYSHATLFKCRDLTKYGRLRSSPRPLNLKKSPKMRAPI
jgi:hypothetical protein